MESEITITGYSRGLNRWHDESGALHAMHDRPEGSYTLSVPLCGARRVSGPQALNPRQLCGTCARLMTQRIRAGMARAFFASSWADQCEEMGHARILIGREIFDIMPRRIDRAALHAARTLHFDIERVNPGHSLSTLYAKCPGTPRLSLESWGHYAAMEAMGHGVGLFEYGIEDSDLTIPYVEFGSHSLERDYFKPAEGF